MKGSHTDTLYIYDIVLVVTCTSTCSSDDTCLQSKAITLWAEFIIQRTKVWLVRPVYSWVVSQEVLAGTEIPEWGKRETTSHPTLSERFQSGGRGRLHHTLHYLYHHQNDSCIKPGSNEGYLSVSWIVTDKVSVDHNFWRERSREPKWNCTEVLLHTSLINALPLGQASSQN